MTETVRVRMYNVGFGDCFLIEFPSNGDRPFRALVDCGAHTAGYPREGWKPQQTVDQIIEDVSDGGEEPGLDLVIASHRHMDHVSGFRSQSWQEVQVGEVWMPWTEHPTEPLASEIRNRQSRLALGLQHAFADPAFQQRWKQPEAVDALRSLVENSLTNEKAMATLHHGFRGRPRRRFLPEGNERTITFPDCPDLEIHVLGPSRDPEVIRDMDPPAGGSYLRFIPEREDEEASFRPISTTLPFSGGFTFDEDLYTSEEIGPTLDASIKKAASSIMRGDDFSVAVSLDRAVNGTSLMLMFEFRDAFLLFPGDAQWGTWNAALTDPESGELLSRTNFYKVGHHGSHNATPVDFVERVLDPNVKVWGVAISVRSIDFWPEIPRAPLLDRLAERADRIIRSDSPGRNRSGVAVRPGKLGVDFYVPC